MNELKITKGHFEYNDGQVFVDTREWVCCGQGTINGCCGIPDVDGSVEPFCDANEHDGPVIAETFNIHNKTGLTPKQLLEQRDELMEAFKVIGDANEADLIGASDPAIRGLLYAAIRVARAAIAKAEERKS